MVRMGQRQDGAHRDLQTPLESFADVLSYRPGDLGDFTAGQTLSCGTCYRIPGLNGIAMLPCFHELPVGPPFASVVQVWGAA